MAKIVTPSEAAALVQDGDRIVMSGFIGMCHPQEVTYAIEKRFLEEGHPKTSISSSRQTLEMEPID